MPDYSLGYKIPFLFSNSSAAQLGGGNTWGLISRLMEGCFSQPYGTLSRMIKTDSALIMEKKGFLHPMTVQEDASW